MEDINKNLIILATKLDSIGDDDTANAIDYIVRVAQITDVAVLSKELSRIDKNQKQIYNLVKKMQEEISKNQPSPQGAQ